MTQERDENLRDLIAVDTFDRTPNIWNDKWNTHRERICDSLDWPLRKIFDLAPERWNEIIFPQLHSVIENECSKFKRTDKVS